MTAVALADAGRAVTVVTKGALGDGSTAWAQGGLAAVLGADDDAELHVQDTLVAGAGLCDEAAVRTLVEEAPAAVAVAAGARRPAGPRRPRPARADPRGRAQPRPDRARRRRRQRRGGHPHARRRPARPRHRGPRAHRRTGRAARRRTAASSACGSPASGTTEHWSTPVTCAPGRPCSPPAATARCSRRRPIPPAPPATGWRSRCGPAPRSPTSRWCSSTRPCSGPARAPRASRRWSPRRCAARAPSSSTATAAGSWSAPTRWPTSPRATSSRPRSPPTCARPASDHVFLDATHLGADFLARRFPGIVRACRDAGFDLDPRAGAGRRRPPTTPAAGWWPTSTAAPSVAGLFAVGEVACTGVQGANRLASNSITEGLVAARRCAALLAADLPAHAEPVPARRAATAIDPAARTTITAATTRDAGVLRDGGGPRAAGRRAGRRPPPATGPLDLAAVETTALHTAATLLAAAAPRGAWRAAAATAAPTSPDPTRVGGAPGAPAATTPAGVHTRTEPVRSLVVA